MKNKPLSLYPLTFDEALKVLSKAKPQKEQVAAMKSVFPTVNLGETVVNQEPQKKRSKKKR